MKYFAALALLLCLGAAHAGEREAVEGNVADVVSTGAGIAMGAAEANPLGPVGVVVAKVVLHQYIKALPAVEQPQAWRLFGAVGWGAAANNLCVVITIATGGSGSVLCPVIGVSTGVGVFVSTAEAARRETFDAICTEARSRQPDLICIYTPLGD